MQKLLAVASFLLLSVVCAQAQTRSAVPLLQAPGAGEPFSKSIALVIGIDGYDKGWRRLGKAVEDARAIAAALPQAGFDEVELKLDLDSASLERTIKDFIYVKGSDPNARLLIWFAGHGHMIAEDGYLVPRDAPDPGDTPASEAAFQSVALPLASFNRYMSEVKARHVLAVFDSCFSGAVFNSSRASVPASIAKSTGLIARQFISSGSYHEEAYDDGAFRRAFVDAISGRDGRALREDGFLTGSRIGAYLAERISAETGGRQNPIYATSNVVGLDRGDFVFPLRYEAGAPARETIALPPALPSELDAPPPELRIERVELAADDPDLKFLGDKLARNLVEYYVTSNVYVSSELTGREPARAPSHRLHARVGDDGDRAVIDLELSRADGITVSAASFSGPKAFLRENYKVLPATAQYMLDVSLRTLTPLRSANRPTASGEAYALFLVARQKASRRQFKAAAELLEQAIGVDESFASAHGARAQLSIQLGEPQSVFEEHMAMATAIDPDFPPLSIFGDEQMGDPVPALRAEAAKTPWTAVRPGLEYRRIETVDYAVGVLAWRYEESMVDVKLARSATTLGETVEEFRKRTDSLLAINAGFFDLDFQSRLSPVGLLVVDGREIQSFDAEKAANPLTGVLFVKDGRMGVMRAREYNAGDRFEAALQTGPLVVDPGGRNGIYRNSYDRQNRSAVCLGFDGRPVLVQVSGGLSLYELGELLSAGEDDGGFGCERAINLDGGPSSQISFLAGGLGVEVPGLWKVGSSLILTAR